MNINYHFVEEKEVFSPALIYYRDMIQKNIEKSIEEAGGAEKLWPHVKTHKSLEVTKLLVKAGIVKFKCATFAEAEMAVQAGAEKILVSYPLVGPNIQQFVRLVKKYSNQTFYAIGDDLSMLEALGKDGKEGKTELNCLVDVNTGMNRTGVSLEEVISFYKKAAELPGIQMRGLHCYDGDRHEKSRKEREEKVKSTIGKVEFIRKTLEKEGLNCENLVMGGSPTFPCYANDMKGVFFSPGTIFIYDEGYLEQFPDLPYVPAAAVLTRVVSHPAEGYFTIDAGYKAISAEQGIRGKLLGCPYAEEAFQSEEHWTFRMKPGHEAERPKIGEILYVIPWHICPTTAMYDKVLMVSDGKLQKFWDVTARGRQMTQE